MILILHLCKQMRPLLLACSFLVVSFDDQNFLISSNLSFFPFSDLLEQALSFPCP